MHYRIVPPADPGVAGVLNETQSWFKRDPEMQRDRKKLVKFRCASELPVSLQGAPRPARVVELPLDNVARVG
jgi:hypothetical protein